MTGPRRRALIESDDVQTGAEIGRAPDELRDADVEIEDIEIVPADRLRTAAAEAKFMEDMVLIEIEGEEDPNAAVFLHSGHNGVSQWIKRGEPQRIKRKYLYSLLAAKRINYACAFGKKGDGNEFNRLKGSARGTHRVRLIEDNNQDGGMRWFQAVSASLSRPADHAAAN